MPRAVTLFTWACSRPTCGRRRSGGRARARRRADDFDSPGHGHGHSNVDFDSMIHALNRIGYDGPLSLEWEGSGMDRDCGAPDALAFARRTDFAPSAVGFDAAFDKEA